MVNEHSAGGVVFKDNLVLLIRNYKPQRGVEFWGFPKGHIEQGESDTEAALREVNEETGIVAKINQKIADKEYSAGFNDNKEEIWKKVSYFLMEFVSGEVTPQKDELSDAIWATIDEALLKLTFDTDKDLLQQAKKLKKLV